MVNAHASCSRPKSCRPWPADQCRQEQPDVRDRADPSSRCVERKKLFVVLQHDLPRASTAHIARGIATEDASCRMVRIWKCCWMRAGLTGTKRSRRFLSLVRQSHRARRGVGSEVPNAEEKRAEQLYRDEDFSGGRLDVAQGFHEAALLQPSGINREAARGVLLLSPPGLASRSSASVLAGNGAPVLTWMWAR